MELDLDFNNLTVVNEKEKALSIICDLFRDFSPILPDDLSCLSDEQLFLIVKFVRDFNFAFTAYILDKRR